MSTGSLTRSVIGILLGADAHISKRNSTGGGGSGQSKSNQLKGFHREVDKLKSHVI